jgi:hypothetical protein
MAQQTAVEWYYDQTVVYGKTNYAELLEQAKQMDKEQIEESWIAGREFGCNHNDPETAEQYYNETYGK